MMQLVVLVTAVCVTGVTLKQPNLCRDDSHCSTGYFCHTDLFRCQECLQCEDLRRETPEPKKQCIKSVADCGLCFKGLVTDRLAGGAGCTEPEAGAGAGGGGGGGGGGVPVWVWAGALGLALVAMVLAALIYVLRHTDSIKLTTRTSVQAPVVCANGHEPSAPAPAPAAAPPPPYYPQYTPVRPSSPEEPAPPPTNPYAEESAAPLVKRRGWERGGGGAGGGGGTRESDGSQNANVFNNPVYVRNVPPPSYDAALSDESDHEPFVHHDEDTMESPWTPAAALVAPAAPSAYVTPFANGHLSHNANATPTSLSVEQETAAGPLVPGRRAERPDRPARPATPDTPPPGKIRRVEDSNNNSGSSGGPPSPPSPPARSPPAAPAAPSFVINVVNVNSVHQMNDVSL